MKLKELDGRLMKVTPEGWETVVTVAEADGVFFQCPKCSEGRKTGSDGDRKFVIGAHGVVCWFVGKVPDDLDPKPGRWNPTGNTLDDLTFVAGEPPRAFSVLLSGPGCGWHGYVKNGEAS